VDPAPDDIPLPLTDPPRIWLARIQSIPGSAVFRLEAGRVLIREGEWPACLWVMLKGAVTLASTGPAGRSAILAVLGREELVGEHGLIPSTVHERDSISFPEARTLVTAVACSTPFPALRRAVAADPLLGRWLAIAAARQASRVRRTLTRTLVMRVSSRLLGVLEDLASSHGRPAPGGVYIALPLTQELLASMVGATRESVNRAVAVLERRGLVRRVGLRYVLCSPSPAPEGSFR
jgi:CRP/FNR family transcriptional regulator, cyclic AMP receptor protein